MQLTPSDNCPVNQHDLISTILPVFCLMTSCLVMISIICYFYHRLVGHKIQNMTNLNDRQNYFHFRPCCYFVIKQQANLYFELHHFDDISIFFTSEHSSDFIASCCFEISGIQHYCSGYSSRYTFPTIEAKRDSRELHLSAIAEHDQKV